MTTPLRVSDPRDLIALAAHCLGFHPRESLVLVSLRGPRKEPGLVARADLSPRGGGPQAVVGALADRVAADGASCAVLFVHTAVTGPPGRPVHRDLVAAVRRSLAAEGVALLDAWLVGTERLRSYTCRRACCPPEGEPLGDVASTLVGTELVWRGSAVARDQAAHQRALRAALAPASAAARRPVERAARGPVGPAERLAALAWWRDAVTAVATGARGGRTAEDVAADVVAPAAAGRLLAALGDVRVRDALLLTTVPGAGSTPERVAAGEHDAAAGGGAAADGLAGGDPSTDLSTELDDVLGIGGEGPDPDRAEAARSLLVVLVRLAAPHRRAAPLGALAWSAWWRGAGSEAAVQAELALEADPDHRLAHLVAEAVARGVLPPWRDRSGPRPGAVAAGATTRPGEEASTC